MRMKSNHCMVMLYRLYVRRLSPQIGWFSTVENLVMYIGLYFLSPKISLVTVLSWKFCQFANFDERTLGRKNKNTL